MTVTKNDIINKLNDLSVSHFTGCVKIGIQDYVFNHVSISNDTDLPIVKNNDDNAIIKKLVSIVMDTGNGTILYKYENGIIVSYSYNVTYKSKALNDFIFNLRT